MKQVELIVVGGFLGAGKTTLLWETARRIASEGKRVGLITNDQAPELVDTTFLQDQGFFVREVAGSCFCCDFNALLHQANALREEIDADVLLAEPVGSCTDLSATILQPLKERYANDFVLSPLSVLADPVRLRETLSGNGRLHPSAVYIAKKQLEEADWIVVNKLDTLSDRDVRELTALVGETFPGRPLKWISAKTGDGVGAWLQACRDGGPTGQWIPEVDYDTYAEGEAALGWLNSVVKLSSATGDAADWRQVCRSLLTRIQQAVANEPAEIGHIKAILSAEKGSILGNVTSVESAVALSSSAAKPSPTATLVLNARVEMAPDRLEAICREVLRSLEESGVRSEVAEMHAITPGRPTPTYRYSEIV